MSIWINHFIDFEKKQHGENRFVLGFQYCPDNERDGHQRKAKIKVRQKLKIPTNIINKESRARVRKRISQNPKLKDFPLRTRWESDEFGEYSVLEIEVPNDRDIIRLLGSEFQRGSYERRLRYNGFYPERTAVFRRALEDAVISGSDNGECAEVEIDDISQIEFFDMINDRELLSLPYVVIDIEKPMWKKPGEKNWLARREKLLKANKRFERLPKKKKNSEEGEKERKNYEKRKHLIERLEERLTEEIEGVGRVKLFDERFRADVSFVTALWRTHEGIEKEVYVLDPNREIEETEHNGYRVRTLASERELISSLIEKFHEKKPVISYGQNQVYDITQLRFAAESNRKVFDPAVKDVKPRRDFVRTFIQRLREDLIYIDTMWLSSIFFPFLRQKRFDTSLKLEDIALFRGIDFKKSLTHEELRDVELMRLAGADRETRIRAAKDMLDYSTADLDATAGIVDSIDFIPLLSALKEALPFCTLSEIAFSTNCMERIHEWRHFLKYGNIQYFGYNKKRRQDSVNAMKKKLWEAKRKMLKYIGFSAERRNTIHHEVDELYIPLEEWLREVAFNIYPKLRSIYDKTLSNPEQHFAFLQYLKSFLNEPLMDYRRARESNERLVEASGAIKRDYPFTDVGGLLKIFGERTNRDKLRRAEYLFYRARELYDRVSPLLAQLPKDRASNKNIRKSNYKNTNETIRGVFYDEPMARALESLERTREEPDLFSSPEENPQKGKNLEIFYKTLDEFIELAESLPGGMALAYPHVLKHMAERESARFRARYGVTISEITRAIGEGYTSLKKEFEEKALHVIDIRGDYVFVTGLRKGEDKSNNDRLSRAIPVRHLEEYVVS